MIDEEKVVYRTKRERRTTGTKRRVKRYDGERGRV